MGVRFMETKEYHDICVKYNFTETCYPNAFFTQADREPKLYDLPTNEQTGVCSNGYCSCPNSNATDTTTTSSADTTTTSSGAYLQMVSGVFGLLITSILVH